MKHYPGLRSIFVGMTMVYAYLVGIILFGLVSLIAPIGEPYLDTKDFLFVPVKLGLLTAGVVFLGIWILTVIIWLSTKERRYHTLLKLAVKVISSACFFLIAAICATYISLCILAVSIRDPSIEWGYSPPLSPPTGAIVLFLTALACGLSAFIYFWSRRVTKSALSELKNMIEETCGKCGYNLRGDYLTGCPECGWGREDEG